MKKKYIIVLKKNNHVKIYLPGENEEFFVKLKALVEETYLMNNKAPVTLLAHSMGGPMSLVFLQRQTQKWKDQYIHSMITLSGAWGGSVKAVKVFAIGDDLGAYLLRGSVLKEEQITSPSLGWLLPSKLFWKDDEVLVITDKMNYTMGDLQQFLMYVINIVYREIIYRLFSLKRLKIMTIQLLHFFLMTHQKLFTSAETLMFPMAGNSGKTMKSIKTISLPQVLKCIACMGQMWTLLSSE